MFCGDFSSVPSGDCVMDRGAAALTKDFFGRWGVVGIASFSLGCNIPEAVSAFVGVAGYVQWIADVMAAGIIRISFRGNRLTLKCHFRDLFE